MYRRGGFGRWGGSRNQGTEEGRTRTATAAGAGWRQRSEVSGGRWRRVAGERGRGAGGVRGKRARPSWHASAIRPARWHRRPRRRARRQAWTCHWASLSPRTWKAAVTRCCRLSTQEEQRAAGAIASPRLVSRVEASSALGPMHPSTYDGSGERSGTKPIAGTPMPCGSAESAPRLVEHRRRFKPLGNVTRR